MLAPQEAPASSNAPISGKSRGLCGPKADGNRFFVILAQHSSSVGLRSLKRRNTASSSVQSSSRQPGRHRSPVVRQSPGRPEDGRDAICRRCARPCGKNYPARRLSPSFSHHDAETTAICPSRPSYEPAGLGPLPQNGREANETRRADQNRVCPAPCGAVRSYTAISRLSSPSP